MEVAEESLATHDGLSRSRMAAQAGPEVTTASNQK